MNDLKRKSDNWNNHRSCRDDSHSSDDSKSSDDNCQLHKRRKVDLDTHIFDLGFTGTKEQLDLLSKRQKKKLWKKLKWAKDRPLKRQREKFRRKLKKIENKMNGIINIVNGRKKKKLNTMASSNCKQRVAIDLSFDDLMNYKDLNKCVKQVSRCYSVNRCVKNPMQFYVTQLNGKSYDVLSKYCGFKNWDVHMDERSVFEMFETNELVYLTEDSENVIEELDDTKVYIIGGLVDHNSHKNLCYRIACDKKISHGRLPIDKYIDMKTTKVLTINHIFEILLKKCHGMSWEEALLKVLPQRKNASLKCLKGNICTENKLDYRDKMLVDTECLSEDKSKNISFELNENDKKPIIKLEPRSFDDDEVNDCKIGFNDVKDINVKCETVVKNEYESVED